MLLAEAEKTKIETIGKAYESITGDHAQAMQMNLVSVDMRRALPKSAIVFEGGGQVREEIKSGFNSGHGFMLAKKGIEVMERSA